MNFEKISCQVFTTSHSKNFGHSNQEQINRAVSANAPTRHDFNVLPVTAPKQLLHKSFEKRAVLSFTQYKEK